MSKNVAVIGAGPAGLMLSQVLTHPHFIKEKTLNLSLFEGHSKPGGCASYFRRKYSGEQSATFDAGATLINSGGHETAFMNKILKKLDLQKLELLPIYETFFYFEKRGKLEKVSFQTSQKYIESLGNIFPQDKEWIYRELPKLFNWAFELKIFVEKLPTWPPQSPQDLFSDFWKLLPQSGKLAGLFFYKDTLFLDWLKKQNASPDFVEFVDMVFLITLQCQSQDVYFPWALFALFFYPLGCATCKGGMKFFFENLLSSLQGRAFVKMRDKVRSLEKTSRGWIVKTGEAEFGPFDYVFSSIPRFNTQILLKKSLGPSSFSFENLKPHLWSALVGYFVVADSPQFPAQSFNIHSKTAEGKEVYFSFSTRNDSLRAPSDVRVVTASTHWPLNDVFSEAYYEEKKKAAGEDFLKTPLLKTLPQIKILFEEYGTPNTFEHYTQRKMGSVGGIPLSTQYTLWNSPSMRTPYAGLYQIGDTSFPGQSIYACTLGALMAAQQVFPEFKFDLD